MAKEKVVLAYSGGLDTTAIIPWLKEHYDYDVICCCIDVGQGTGETDGLEERALSTGASKLYLLDVCDEFAEEYITPCVMAHAVYENEYLLGTSMARPLIAKKLVEVARKEGAAAICHGATGKGNDQIRFELGIKALAPDLKIIAPWRDDKWDMQSRQDEIDYCKAHGIMVTVAPGANSNSVAEHTIMFILMLARHAVVQDENTRNGNYNARNTIAGHDVIGKTLAILGLGRIGRLVAEKAHFGLGMEIVAFDPYVPQEKAPEYV